MPFGALLRWLACLAACTSLSLAGEESSELTIHAEKGDWDVQFRPYAWTLNFSGEVGVGPLVADADADFDDILEDLEAAWACTLDVRHKGSKWSLFLDLFHVDLESSAYAFTRNVDVEKNIVDACIGYRLHEEDHAWLECVVGARWVSVEAGITPILGPAAGVEESWVDPHLGLRFRQELNDKWYIGGGAGIGGFGVGSDLTWQFVGGVGYFVTDTIAVEAIYRIISMDYDDGGFVYDTEINGLMLGLAIQL